VLLERLLENLGLEVEPFATCGVAPGWRLRLPAQQAVTLHFILRGVGAIGNGAGARRTLPTHSLAVVPAGLEHMLECGTGNLAESPSAPDTSVGMPALQAGPHGDEELVVACGRVRVTWGGALGLFDQLRDLLVVDFADTPQVLAVFTALLAEQQRDAPGKVRMMAALMQQCMVELFRRLCEDQECRLPWLHALEDDRIARVLDAMISHPEQPHTVETLARTAAMSRSAFAARFREACGRPPMEYLREVRLRAAARLLQRGELPVDVVADRSGFASRSHFSRAFRTMYGQSPTTYRAAGGRGT